ncbi:MAG: hypothetical protein V8Q88_01445 [Christensenellales bacterium]
MTRNAINATNSDFTILSDDEIVKKALSAANGSGFKALWEGITVGYPSHSEADLALCMRLAFCKRAATPCKLDSLFRQSGLMREKWDSARAGITYGESTIQRAIGQCRETYTPPKKPDVKPIKADAIPVKQEVASKPISRFIPIRPLTPQWSDLPAFPLDALPETLRSYAAAVAEHSQTSPDMASVMGLACCPSACRKISGGRYAGIYRAAQPVHGGYRLVRRTQVRRHAPHDAPVV